MKDGSYSDCSLVAMPASLASRFSSLMISPVRSMRTRVPVKLLVTLFAIAIGSQQPAQAIGVCWDYVMYRVNLANNVKPADADPNPPAKKKDNTYDTLIALLKTKGREYEKVTPTPRAEELQEGDVVIIPNHCGYAVGKDRIDHYKQVFGETVAPNQKWYDVNHLRENPKDKDGKVVPGGLMRNWTLAKFRGSATSYEVWRKKSGVWGLVEVIADPGRSTQGFTRKGPNFEHVEEFKPNSYLMDHKDWHDTQRTKQGQTYKISIKMDPPPAQITPSKDFTLKVSATCAKQTMTDWVRRFGGYEVTGGIDVKLASSSFKSPNPNYQGGPFVGNDDRSGFIAQATAEYKFTVPAALSEEFTIEQKGLAIFKYRKGATPIALPK